MYQGIKRDKTVLGNQIWRGALVSEVNGLVSEMEINSMKRLQLLNATPAVSSCQCCPKIIGLSPEYGRGSVQIRA